MKKYNIIYILIISLLLLCSCGRNTVVEVASGKYTAMVDTWNHTIIVDGNVYSYKQTENSLTIVWPDGVSYTKTYYPNAAMGGSSGTIDSSIYPSEYVMFKMLDSVLNRQQTANVLSVWQVVSILLGITMVACPRIFWFMSYGWRFRDAEPGSFALPVFRFIGVIIIVVIVGKTFFGV